MREFWQLTGVKNAIICQLSIWDVVSPGVIKTLCHKMLRSAPLRSKWSKMFNRCERLQVLTKIDLIMRNYKESEVLNWPLRRCKGQAPRVAQKSNVCENHAQISVWMNLEIYDDFEPKFWGIDTWGVMPRAWGAGGTFQCARAQGQNSLNPSDTCINLSILTSKNQESKEIQESKNLRIAKDTDSEEQSLKLLLRSSA